MHLFVILFLCLPTLLCSTGVQLTDVDTDVDICVVDMHNIEGDIAPVRRESHFGELDLFHSGDELEPIASLPEISDDTVTVLSASVQEHHITIEDLNGRLVRIEKADQEEAFDRECTAITAGGALFVGTVSLMLSIVNLVAQSSETLSSVNGTDI